MAIKFLNPTTVKKIVSMNDDSIDREKTNMEAYAEDYDMSKLVFIEGMKPTIFTIKNVGSTHLVEIQQDHIKTELPTIVPGMTAEAIKNVKVKVTQVKTGEMLIKYFRAGCKAYTDENGKEVEITPEVLETIPPMVIQEIGSFIMSTAILSDSKKK